MRFRGAFVRNLIETKVILHIGACLLGLKSKNQACVKNSLTMQVLVLEPLQYPQLTLLNTSSFHWNNKNWSVKYV